jgi:alpha-galactosidase/6-phospho-beta-glucosidase family protein
MLAIEAAIGGDETTTLQALLANPLVHNNANRLLDAIIEANLPYLPQFAPQAHGIG